jgi:hypothetical protein
VVVVSVYTKPGLSVTVYRSPTGVTSAVCTNWSEGLSELRFVAHTCTVVFGSPPIARTDRACVAVASTVSTIVLYALRLGDFSVT